MATLVCFHAHPDDEAIATGGVMALAADGGHRVVLVVATRGEHGEPVAGVLRPGEALWERRVEETVRSAEILGTQRVEFLGYVDSGMMGAPTNDDPDCFWQADVEEAAGRLAALLIEESADALTVYDDHGLYGHPDHIQVYRVGRRAAELVGLDPERVFCSTMSRDRIRRYRALQAEEVAASVASGEASAPDPDDEPAFDIETFGTPEDDITHAIDVRAALDRKRRAMQAHRSQISEDAFSLNMPDEVFEQAFGTECFTSLGLRRAPGAPFWVELLEVRS